MSDIPKPSTNDRSSRLDLFLVSTLGFCAASFPSGAAAQSTDSPGRQIEEVIVTAQKREQSLQDVPLSISAITSDTLEDTGLVGIQDLAEMTPGLIFSETIGRQTTAPSIRGVAPFGFADSTVVVMMDGYTSGFQRSGNNATLMELERIEILRGPQATLYGRNAIGGVINYITKKPDNDPRVSFRADAASRDTHVLQGSVSGPLIQDTLFAGLGLGYREFGGFMDNAATGQQDVNDEQDINSRLNLRYIPLDRLELGLTVDYNEADDAVGDPSHSYHDAYLSDNPPTLPEVGAGQFDFNDFERTISQRDLGGFDREESTVVLEVEYDLEWAMLTSITGASNQETSIRTPFDRLETADFTFDVQWDVESKSQELRLASLSASNWQWLVGAYFFDNQRERALLLDFGDGPFVSQNSLDEVDNKALFVNLEYRLTDTLTLSGGMRYDSEERTQTDLLSGDSASSDVDEVLPNVSLTFQPNDGLTVYGTISRGYHAGGPNELGSIAAGAPRSYDPEFLTNYEIGIKGSLATLPLSYEAAVFYMDWEDQQIFTDFDIFNRFIINAGESRILGIEFSGRYEPTENLSLYANVSALDPEYRTFVNPIDAEPFGLDPDLSGNQLVYSSKFSASAGVQYLRPRGDGGWRWRLRVDGNHVGDRPTDTTNLFMADAYTLLNLYAGIENERYEIGLFVDNATDEDYLTGGLAPSAGFPALATVGDPRIAGIRFRFDY